MDLRCNEELRYVPCPVCGLPVVEGQCKAGHPYYVHTLSLSELPEFLARKDIGEFREWECCVLEKSDSYLPIEEQLITIEIRPSYEKLIPVKSTAISVYIDERYTNRDMIRSAIQMIVAEFLYRPECRNPVHVVKKWYPKEHRIRMRFTVRISPQMAEKLREAAQYFGLKYSHMIEAYARMWWVDEVEERI
ncbi:hypothetical protein AciM339_1097 [Aciduliprofundum sp. MAR08-339]|uniref:hypothetical protein n=1 Tax=Aciduliprofundum sp. (strain MAR08-339) TaxID=673860 RepID=UPI0002A480B6|nr:hypothetical protein AciM339_1097 [Aciduliprofundum sp. MAR08-339]